MPVNPPVSHTVEVNLMGRTFTIRTDDTPEKVMAAANIVQSRVDELRRLGAAVASDRLLALVALNLASELLQKEHGQLESNDGLLSELDGVILQLEGLAKAPLR